MALDKSGSVGITNITLNVAEQISGQLCSQNENARFTYYLMHEEEFAKVNATGNYYDAKCLAQNSYVNRDNFLKTVEKSGVYFLVIENKYFLGQNVSYTFKVYTTRTDWGSVGFLFVVWSTSCLAWYVYPKEENE